MTKLFPITMLALALLAAPSMAKDKVITHSVHFDKGSSSTTVKGDVAGYDTVNYTLGAQAGQTMKVRLDSGKAYMNIFAPGQGVGKGSLFSGDMSGNSFVGKLPKNGTYTIQVYLMRNEARRGTKAPYTLHIEID